MLELRHGVVTSAYTPIYVKGGAHLIRHPVRVYGASKPFPSRCVVSLPGFARPQFARERGTACAGCAGWQPPGIVTRDQPMHALDDLRGPAHQVPTELLPLMRELGPTRSTCRWALCTPHCQGRD